MAAGPGDFDDACIAELARQRLGRPPSLYWLVLADRDEHRKRHASEAAVTAPLPLGLPVGQRRPGIGLDPLGEGALVHLPGRVRGVTTGVEVPPVLPLSDATEVIDHG